jgi:hypothetical protein
MKSAEKKLKKLGYTSLLKKIGNKTLWRVGLLFGVIGFIISLLYALFLLNNLLTFRIEISDIFFQPVSLLLFLERFTPLCACLGIICISLAGLMSSDKDIDSEIKDKNSN